MRISEALVLKLTTCIACSALSLFGGYIGFEKSVVPILNGVTEERGGPTFRADEPILFWVSVGMFGLIGFSLLAIGLWGIWRAIKQPSQ